MGSIWLRMVSVNPDKWFPTYRTGGFAAPEYSLYSLNPQYPYGEKNEDDHVQIVGKVIGTVSADEIPDAEDAAILKELKSDELYEFDREYGVPL